MKFLSVHDKCRILYSRILFLMLSIVVSCLAIQNVCYAADDSNTVIIQGTKYEGTYSSLSSVKNPADVHYGLTLSYDDVINYFGPVVDEQLQFTIDNVKYVSYKDTNGSVNVVTIKSPDFTSGTYTIKYTPASGGSYVVNTFSVGEEVSISYNGGDIVFMTDIIGSATYSTIGQLGSIKVAGFDIVSDWTFVLPYDESDKPLTDNEALNELVNQNNQYREEDRNNAEQAGSDASTLVSDMQSLESKWEILWLPITFTKRVITVFTGGSSSASYIRSYANIVGYTYNESTGFLEPIYGDPIMSIADVEVPGGAVITFPGYTLPYLDVKLWDSYSYDLSTIKDDFPALFNALYVFISILEVYWFVAFCLDKYHEIFD